MSEEEVTEEPKRRRRRKLNLSGDDAKVIVTALLDQIQSGAKQTTLDADTRASMDQEFKSQIEKYHAEPHFWFTWHYNGEDDHIEVEHIGAAGVNYFIRKEERILLPQSAINCLKYAVVKGLDHGRPVEINGKKYIRKVDRPRFNYTIEPTPVSPEEAAIWRAKFQQTQVETDDLIPLDNGQSSMSDFVQVG